VSELREDVDESPSWVVPAIAIAARGERTGTPCTVHGTGGLAVVSSSSSSSSSSDTIKAWLGDPSASVDAITILAIGERTETPNPAAAAAGTPPPPPTGASGSEGSSGDVDVMTRLAIGEKTGSPLICLGGAGFEIGFERAAIPLGAAATAGPWVADITIWATGDRRGPGGALLLAKGTMGCGRGGGGGGCSC